MKKLLINTRNIEFGFIKSQELILVKIINKINEIVEALNKNENAIKMNLSVTPYHDYNLKVKSWNAKTFKKWMRKGNCPGCGVSCGSDHKPNCWARKQLLESLKDRKKRKEVK